MAQIFLLLQLAAASSPPVQPLSLSLFRQKVVSVRHQRGQHEQATFNSCIFREIGDNQDAEKFKAVIIPLFLDHPTVPLVLLALSHRSEKKSNWTLMKNDRIKLLHLHKQNKTFHWDLCINCTSKNYNAIQTMSTGKSPKLRLVPKFCKHFVDILVPFLAKFFN